MGGKKIDSSSSMLARMQRRLNEERRRKATKELGNPEEIEVVTEEGEEKAPERKVHPREFKRPSHPLDEVEQEEFEKQVENLIKKAAKKIKDHPEIKTPPDISHNETLLEKAKNLFLKVYKALSLSLPKDHHLSPLELANIALLGVLSVSQSGSQQVYIIAGSRRVNELAAPNMSIYHNPDNYSFLSSEDVIDFTQDNSLGLESEAVDQLLERGAALIPELIEFFEEAGYLKVKRLNEEEARKKETAEADTGRKSPFTTPELRPPVQFTEDEGEGE